MKCYLCRLQLGPDHAPAAIAMGRGDETQPGGGFLLCFPCSRAVIQTWAKIYKLFNTKKAGGHDVHPPAPASSSNEMRCHICRLHLGPGHAPVAMVMGRGDETHQEGGFRLCQRCAYSVVNTLDLVDELIHEQGSAALNEAPTSD